MGPCGDIDHVNGDIYSSLNNDSWCWAILSLLAAKIRACTCTRDLPTHCNFPLDYDDTFEIASQLRRPAMQLEAIQFMVAQLSEQFLPDALGLPAPRVEVIHMHIWARLEDALRAKLKAEAAVLSTHILGMGLSDITKQILSGASRQEITEVMQEEIQWRNVAISATSCSPPVDKQQSLH